MDPHVDSSPDETRNGLRHLSLCVLCAAAIAVVSYAHGSLYRFRPWVGGEPVPIVRMFIGEQAGQHLPGFAEAGLLASSGQGDLDELLGSSIADSLAEDNDDEEPGEAVTAALARVAPLVVTAALPDGGLAEGPGRGAPGSAPAVRIRPEEYAGLSQEIESPELLRRFFAKLEKTADKRDGAITRVAHYGDSSVAADAITRTARRHMQQRFGDSGHGFILISRGDMHYGHHDIRHRSSDGWEMLSLVRDPLRSGFYGYGGVQARGTRGDYAWFATSKDDARVGMSASRFELYFQRWKRGGRVRIEVDGQQVAMVDTRSKQRGDGFEAVDVPDGPHEFRVKALGSGSVRLYGAVLERKQPGVVYDSLGLVGARAERLLNANPAHMRAQLAHRDADLLVLGFGGNEAGNKWLQLDRYEEDLVKVVRLMRSGDPGMDCLLFGPLDQAERNQRGDIVTIETLPQIVEVQRRVAKAEKCAFFDTFKAMGGHNAIRRWYRSRPRLATSDLRHATPKGYQVVGKLYYKALLKGFADYLDKK